MKVVNGREFGSWDLGPTEALQYGVVVSELHDFTHFSQTWVSASVLVPGLHRCLSFGREGSCPLYWPGPQIFHEDSSLLCTFLPEDKRNKVFLGRFLWIHTKNSLKSQEIEVLVLMPIIN